MVAVIIIFIMGVKDDLLILTATQKFIGELIAFDLLIFFGNLRITDIHGFLGFHEINLIDGIDGLAAGITGIATFTFGLWFWFTGQLELVIIATATPVHWSLDLSWLFLR